MTTPEPTKPAAPSYTPANGEISEENGIKPENSWEEAMQKVPPNAGIV
jgi:hypothetical protein